MVADVRASMNAAVCGKPTRNFHGQSWLTASRGGTLPQYVDESATGVSSWGEKRSLERLKGPCATGPRKFLINYVIQVHSLDVTFCTLGDFRKSEHQGRASKGMTESRELIELCQESSALPTSPRRYSEALQNLDRRNLLELLAML